MTLVHTETKSPEKLKSSWLCVCVSCSVPKREWSSWLTPCSKADSGKLTHKGIHLPAMKKVKRETQNSSLFPWISWGCEALCPGTAHMPSQTRSWQDFHCKPHLVRLCSSAINRTLWANTWQNECWPRRDVHSHTNTHKNRS